MTTTYPLVRRLLGTLGADWRAERRDPLDYLVRRVDEEDAAAVSAELGELCARAGSEYDYVSVIVESGARFSPYGEFATAEAFVHRLRERLAGATSPAPGQPASDRLPRTGGTGEPGLPCSPRVTQLLVMLYAKGLATFSQVLDDVGEGLGRLVDIGDVDPGAVAAELAELLEAGRSEADFAKVTGRAGVRFTPDAAYPTAGDFLRALRERLIDPATGGPELAGTPDVVIQGTLTALKRGELHAAMTGLARMYGVPELGIARFRAFEARVGDLLDQVLPQWVAGYVDDATLAAETVADETGWMRARWMRSAVELLLTAYGGRAAAELVDRQQVAQIDDLLCAPTCRFGIPAGRSTPRFPNSHWWWRADPPSEDGAHRAGLPMHPRWYPWPGVWRVKVPVGDPSRDEPGLAEELSARMTEATLVAFGEQLRSRSATVMVQVLDAGGSVVWADASLRAEVRDGRLAVTDTELAAAPPGARVVTSATVRGVFGRGGHRAEWSVELLRGCGDDGREVTTGGSAVFALSASHDASDAGVAALGSGDAAALATALETWEQRLGAPLIDWRSSCRPTLVNRYGWGCDVFAAGPPPARPLLHGVSRHLWNGELRLGLVGICRAYGARVLDDVDRRVWHQDWIAALAHAGGEAVEAFLTGLVDETRQLDYPRWHLLCAARSGIQLVGEELADERLAGLFPVGAIRTFDDAMRSFGRRFGPVPRAHVPGGYAGSNVLWDEHPWWRYPANAPEAGALVELDGLAAALWAELDLPERDRKTKAPTRSLAAVLRAVRAVCDGEAAGFTERVATHVSEQVADRWDLGAALTDDVLRYFQPIARSTDWPLPAPSGHPGRW